MVRNLNEMGRELAFWSDFIGVLKLISARNLKNIVFPSKNVVWMQKTTMFEKKCYYKNRWSKIEFLTKFLDDSAWFCMEKLKKPSSRQKTNKYKKYSLNLKNTYRNRLYRCLQGALHPALSYSLYISPNTSLTLHTSMGRRWARAGTRWCVSCQSELFERLFGFRYSFSRQVQEDCWPHSLSHT